MMAEEGESKGKKREGMALLEGPKTAEGVESSGFGPSILLPAYKHWQILEAQRAWVGSFEGWTHQQVIEYLLERMGEGEREKEKEAEDAQGDGEGSNPSGKSEGPEGER